MNDKAGNRGKTERDIRNRLLQAIFELRMAPGTRLTESILAETFDVSRTIIRLVIARLLQEGVLVKQSNGATCVAAPTREELAQIMWLRRTVEPEIVADVARSHKKRARVLLENHLMKEQEARRSGNYSELVRLTGEFHLLVAELSGNRLVVNLIAQLQALVCLGLLLFTKLEQTCAEDEHSLIADAIIRGDANRARSLMLDHLGHVERKILPFERQSHEIHDTLKWLASG